MSTKASATRRLYPRGNCPETVHALLRLSGRAFRSSCTLTFRWWGVDEAGHDEEYQAANCSRCGSTLSVPVGLLASGNPFEARARAEKVGLMLAMLPMGSSRAEMDALADTLASFDEDGRARWASAAGAKSPASPETWAELMAAARLRLTASEIMERAGAEAVR